jgi:hypothetical protein
VRQGENLSSFLFALFLNDLQSFLDKENLPGLKTISEKIGIHSQNGLQSATSHAYLTFY